MGHRCHASVDCANSGMGPGFLDQNDIAWEQKLTGDLIFLVFRDSSLLLPLPL